MLLHNVTYGQGPDLVLLHGWGFDGLVWQSVLPYLIPYFTVHCVDLPGFGLSPMVEQYTLAELSHLLVKQIAKPAYWLGWSLGGLIAMYIARYYSLNCLGLLSVASSPKFTAEQGWPGVQPALLDEFGRALQDDHKTTLKRFLQLQLPQSTLVTAGGSTLNAIYNLKQYVTPARAALNAGLILLKETDLRQEFTRINCPTLHVLGTLDMLVPKKLALYLPQLAPSHEIMLMPKVAHAPFMTQPDIFSNKIRKFVDYVSTR
ncbi:MAG: pimeloyl-ACP methyl ester esterase BioH [Gammaproteobacteria bacterium]